MTRPLLRTAGFVAGPIALVALLAGACSSEDTAAGGAAGAGASTGSGGSLFGGMAPGGSSGCSQCSDDYRAVVDCDGNVIQVCDGGDLCNPLSGTCQDGCQVAAANKHSVGCDYYATYMDFTGGLFMACYVAYVANTADVPVHIAVAYDGVDLPVADFVRIPSGSGSSLAYEPYDEAAGLPPGEVAILFLSGESGDPPSMPAAPCPIESAVPTGVLLELQTGIGKAFHITTDVPVVAYQMSPFGGGVAAASGASLLIPTSAWDANYVAVNAYEDTVSAGDPSLNVIAMSDATTVSIVPVADVVGGGAVPASSAGVPMHVTLAAGEHLQITQPDALTGSIVQADKPVGFMGGHSCMYVPDGAAACDHGEQMIPPIRALGSQYAGVMHEPRTTEPGIWRVLGVVDGTALSYSNDVGGPSTIGRGEIVEFVTPDAFVVESQDPDHPFLLLGFMSGQTWVPPTGGTPGIGDPEFVISVPVDQYLREYVFFADPTFAAQHIVVVRAPEDGSFADVVLDCAGAITGWTPVGDLEWARVELVQADYQPVGSCDAGRHEIHSDAPFGLWVWGWGPVTSYGYPGGMNVRPINEVVIPVPR